jgi:hypothetical protein
MKYRGKTYNLPLVAPGLGYSRNSLVSQLGSMVSFRNCNIHELGVGKRGGTSIINNISGNPRITGLHDFRLKTGERWIIRSTEDGKIYKDNSNTIKTGLSTRYAESLNEGNFATHAKWDTTGDFDDTGGNLEYTHSAGSGTATQTIANMALALRPNSTYELTYDVSDADADIVITIPTTCATSATTLITTSTGTSRTVTFFTIDTPTGFILSGTSSSAGNVILDNLSLKEIGGSARSVKFNTYKEKLIYTNGIDFPQVWNGSSATSQPFSGVSANDIRFEEFGGIGPLANPTAGDTITLNGHVMTFASPAPGADDILIGATTVDTMNNAVTKLNAHANVEVAKCTYSNPASSLYMYRDTATEGDPYELQAAITGGVSITGVHKEFTVKLGANPADGDYLQLVGAFFTFKTTVTSPKTQVEIGANLAATLDNIITWIEDPETGALNANLDLYTYAEDDVDTITVTTVDSTNGIGGYAAGGRLVAPQVTVAGVYLCGRIAGTVDFYDAGFSGAGQQIQVYESSTSDGTYTTSAVPITSTNANLYLAFGTTFTYEPAGSATPNVCYGIPTDWTDGDMPKYSMIYNVGNAKGILFYGVRTYPGRIYIVPDDSFDASDSNVVTFTIETEDAIGVVGAREYGQRQFVHSMGSGWYLNLLDTSTSNWTFVKVPYRAGVMHDRVMVEANNDLYIMSPDGNIYSVKRVQEYGDYEAGSLTKPTPSRPYDVNRWIIDNIDFNYFEDFHANYDPDIEAVLFWVVRSGQTTSDTALAYFVNFDRWLILDNRTSNSGYSASCSFIYTGSGEARKLYTGDHSGNVWKLNQSDRNDNSNGYYAGFELNPFLLPQGDIISDRRFDKVWLVQEVDASVDMTVTVDVDGTQFSTGTVAADAKHTTYDIGKVGREIAVEVSNSTADDDFFLMGLVFYVDDRGEQPT